MNTATTITPEMTSPAGVMLMLHKAWIDTYSGSSDWEARFHQNFGDIHLAIVVGVSRKVFDANAGIDDAPLGINPWIQIAGVSNVFSSIGGLGQYWPGDRGYCRRAVESCFDVLSAYRPVPSEMLSGVAFEAEIRAYAKTTDVLAWELPLSDNC